MPFAVSMVWLEPINHESDCYFCMTKIKGFTKKTRSKIIYADCPSALKPVPHNEEMPVPKPPPEADIESSPSKENLGATGMDMSNQLEPEPELLHLLNQTHLNDLVRDLKLSKDKSELLSSRLKGWNLLQPGTKVTYFRDRHTSLAVFFKEDKNICYCFDIDGVFRELGSVFTCIGRVAFIY